MQAERQASQQQNQQIMALISRFFNESTGEKLTSVLKTFYLIISYITCNIYILYFTVY